MTAAATEAFENKFIGNGFASRSVYAAGFKTVGSACQEEAAKASGGGEGELCQHGVSLI